MHRPVIDQSPQISTPAPPVPDLFLSDFKSSDWRILLRLAVDPFHDCFPVASDFQLDPLGGLQGIAVLGCPGLSVFGRECLHLSSLSVPSAASSSSTGRLSHLPSEADAVSFAVSISPCPRCHGSTPHHSSVVRPEWCFHLVTFAGSAFPQALLLRHRVVVLQPEIDRRAFRNGASPS